MTPAHALQPHHLSPHLFWDVDVMALDTQCHRKLIIARVLQFGLIADWHRIRDHYGLAEIARVALTLRDLDPKAAAFISLLANLPREHFACCISRRSAPTHWVS